MYKFTKLTEMQERQQDRRRYFDELAHTSRKYIMPYVSRFMDIRPGAEILEIGCGEGGNLLPFANAGCITTGIDLAEGKIRNAVRYFGEEGVPGNFQCSDIFEAKGLEDRFDLILCHDVMEHIADKPGFMERMKAFLKPEGIIFIAFPAWQMPFGGHQQMCRNGKLSRLPFFHLLPASWYRRILEKGGENPDAIKEFLEIKQTATTVELFERLVKESGFTRLDRHLYFINPHYEAKFGMRPRSLSPAIAGIPYLRDFFSSSCFYILSK